MSTALRKPLRGVKPAVTLKATALARADTIGQALGLKLRTERQAQGVSVRSFARTLGVSPSLISQIERGLVMPSVGTLYGMCTELGLTLDYVFDQDAETAPKRTDPRLDRANVAAVQRGQGRKRIHLANGVHWELLTVQAGENPEFWRVEYDVGASTGPEDALVRHGGSEYGYVLSGRLGVRIGSDTFELSAGDSISFSSENPHRLWTIGQEPVLAMWIVFSCSKVRSRKRVSLREPERGTTKNGPRRAKKKWRE